MESIWLLWLNCKKFSRSCRLLLREEGSQKQSDTETEERKSPDLKEESDFLDKEGLNLPSRKEKRKKDAVFQKSKEAIF